MIDVFLVCDDVDRASAVRAAIAADSEFALASDVRTGREGIFATSSIARGHPRLLVVRLALGDMNGLEVISQVRQKSPDMWVVPILEGNEGGQTWQSLLQMELRDVIVGPMPPAEMLKVLRAAGAHAQELYNANRGVHGPMTGEAYIITVAGARSGVGKSVIACNLAAVLARHNPNTAFLDFSLHAGDVIVMLDEVPRNTILEAVGAGGGIDAELLNNLLATHPKYRMRYLACPNQDFDASTFDYNIALSIVQTMRHVSQYVVIDTGMASVGPTIAAVDASDLTFVVTTRDVIRLLATQRFLKYLKTDRNVPNEKIKVLVNQSEIGAEISESEIEALLEHPVAAYLPSNPVPVAFSVNSGSPITIAEPQYPISVVLSKLAELCLHRWQEPVKGSTASGGRSAGGGRTGLPTKINLR